MRETVDRANPGPKSFCSATIKTITPSTVIRTSCTRTATTTASTCTYARTTFVIPQSRMGHGPALGAINPTRSRVTVSIPIERRLSLLCFFRPIGVPRSNAKSCKKHCRFSDLFAKLRTLQRLKGSGRTHCMHRFYRLNAKRVLGLLRESVNNEKQ